jgi:hypothetical protein
MQVPARVKGGVVEGLRGKGVVQVVYGRSWKP